MIDGIYGPVPFSCPERTYRQNKYLASGTVYTNESDHTTGLQNVELAYRRGDVDKTSAWQSSSAQTDWSYDRDNATRDKTDAINEANRNLALDTAWADADKILQLAQIAEDVTEANTNKTAKYTRATGLVTADTNYRDGQFTAAVAAWTAVNSALNNAWSDAKLDEATAKQSAWNTVRPQFITKETDIAVAEQSYRGTAITEYDLMAQEAADARHDGTVDQANVNVTVATARGTATEKYGHGIADATRDWQKLDAWTKRHARWGSLDTTTAPNNIVWGTAAPTVEGTYFNDMAQAARDEVTWWGTAYLTQVDREALAVKTQDANLAEAARVRDNAIAGYESAFDVLWNNTVNTAVQAAMFSVGVALTPWHGYVGATTQAEHDRTATTRPAELTLDTARNDAEKIYQVAVADARKTLAHNRGQQDINKAMQDANTDIAAALTEFNSRTPLEQPTALEYSDGFGEPFPARPRRAVEYIDPTMPFMPVMRPSVFEPVGYGLYEDGAPKPWADLLHPPAQIGMAMPTMPPTNSGLPNFTPWFAQGYEPEWPASLYATSFMPGMGIYYTSAEAHDEYGDGMDGAEPLPGDFSFSAQYQPNFAWNSPASVFGRAQSQTAWEELVTSQTTTSSAPWWKATMSTVYTGATGPKINGNSLVTLLTNAVEGAAGVNLPDPGASTLLTSTSSTPADPTRVGGPQATVPGNTPDRPQGKSDTQLTIEARAYNTTETTLAQPYEVALGDVLVSMGEAEDEDEPGVTGVLSGGAGDDLLKTDDIEAPRPSLPSFDPIPLKPHETPPPGYIRFGNSAIPELGSGVPEQVLVDGEWRDLIVPDFEPVIWRRQDGVLLWVFRVDGQWYSCVKVPDLSYYDENNNLIFVHDFSEKVPLDIPEFALAAVTAPLRMQPGSQLWYKRLGEYMPFSMVPLLDDIYSGVPWADAIEKQGKRNGKEALWGMAIGGVLGVIFRGKKPVPNNADEVGEELGGVAGKGSGNASKALGEAAEEGLKSAVKKGGDHIFNKGLGKAFRRTSENLKEIWSELSDLLRRSADEIADETGPFGKRVQKGISGADKNSEVFSDSLTKFRKEVDDFIESAVDSGVEAAKAKHKASLLKCIKELMDAAFDDDAAKLLGKDKDRVVSSGKRALLFMLKRFDDLLGE